MRYLLNHTILMDHDLWHLIALVFFLLVLAIVWKKIKALKKEQEELEDRISGLNTETVADSANLSFMDDLFEETPSETSKT